MQVNPQTNILSAKNLMKDNRTLNETKAKLNKCT